MEKELTNIFILDIETKPQESLIEICSQNIKPSGALKDPEKIKADIENKKLGLKKTMSTDIDLADVICIGVKRLRGEPILYSPQEMETFFNENPLATFITYNGKKFDIPLLIRIGIKNNLDFPYYRLREMCKRWSNLGHYDLMEIICDGEYKSLDFLLQVYCGVSKKPIDFETASEEEIREHCLEDLRNTEILYRKFSKLIY